MSYQLYADPFTQDDVLHLESFQCGEEPWARAAESWIKSSDVWDSITRRGTKVWLFRTDEDAIVGFGSLGTTRRRYPPPDGDYERLLIIPQLGLDVQYRGQPSDPEWRYSDQIMRHLLFEAEAMAREISASAPPRKRVRVLILEVHRDNHAAQRLYTRFDFQRVPNYERNQHIAMDLRLAD